MDRDLPTAFHQHLIDPRHLVDIARIGRTHHASHRDHQLPHSPVPRLLQRVPARPHDIRIIGNPPLQNLPHLFRRHPINPGEQMDPLHFDVEVSPELREAGVRVCPENQIRPVLRRPLHARAVLPVPLVHQQRQHHGL